MIVTDGLDHGSSQFLGNSKFSLALVVPASIVLLITAGALLSIWLKCRKIKKKQKFQIIRTPQINKRPFVQHKIPKTLKVTLQTGSDKKATGSTPSDRRQSSDSATGNEINSIAQMLESMGKGIRQEIRENKQ